ncbi:hypothetical protein [Runella sp.]|jgi:hypothetical protein|uniref:hypothetical protein n=1 Tax=Runella sp. TaxID=1960881 RepID=UPI002632FF82|nr:hypothetical protein [Runella sp.]
MKNAIHFFSFIFLSVSLNAQMITLPTTPTSNLPVDFTIRTFNLDAYINAKVGRVDNATNGNIYLNTGGYDNGNVGIGVNGALPAKLTIREDFATDTRFRILATDLFGQVQGLELRVEGNSGDKHAHIIQKDNANLYLGTNNLNRMSIAAGGNVVVGTTTPNSKLQIDGDFSLNKKLLVTTTGALNNLDRTGSSIIKFTGSGSVTLTGVAGGQDGMLLYIYSNASTTLNLTDESGSSLAANRLKMGANQTITGVGGCRTSCTLSAVTPC